MTRAQVVGIMYAMAPDIRVLLPFLLTACATEPGPLDDSRQLLAVRTLGWDHADGLLQRYQRDSTEADWEPAGPPVRIVVGRSGLAWGLGKHPAALSPGPLKREGDGRAPAGVFALGEAFGAPAATEVTWLRWPYRQATEYLRCPDDPRSRSYNQLVDTRITPQDWNSAEGLLRTDGLYHLGLFVEHNSHPVLPGCGSCIFLHIWSGAGQGTSGCTAMDAGDLTALLGWLDPTAAPRLVQLPESLWAIATAEWDVPER